MLSENTQIRDIDVYKQIGCLDLIDRLKAVESGTRDVKPLL
jgi:hypothetical protein